VFCEGLEQLETDHPVALGEEGLEIQIIGLEVCEAMIHDLEGCLLDEIGGQGAVRVVSDAIGKPDEVVEICGVSVSIRILNWGENELNISIGIYRSMEGY
jgi:hypothetical protein